MKLQHAPLFLLAAGIALAQPQWQTPPRQSMDQMVAEEAARFQIPALGLAVSDAQRTLHQSLAGQAKANTVFRAGSVTKLFTDIAIMQLVEQGKVDLDAPVSQYVPDFHPKNPFGKPLTVRLLMCHRSGLVREPGVGHYFDTKPTTLKAVTRSLNATSLVFEPGTQLKYSNAGITVLGDLIERVSKLSYEEYLRRYLLGPLGLKETWLRAADVPAGRLPSALMWTLDGREFPAPTFEMGIAPAGNLYTTTEDLLRVARWLMQADTKPVLSRQSLDAMAQPQAGGTQFGLGFSLGQVGGAPSIGHGGAIYGFSTDFLVIPSRQFAAVAYGTRDSSNAVLSQLTRAMAAPQTPFTHLTALTRPLPETHNFQQMPPPASPAFAAALGEYGWDYNKLYLHERNGKLHCLIEWFSDSELIPTAANLYRFPDRAMYGGETLRITPKGVFVGPVFFPRLPEPNRNFRVVMQKKLPELKTIAATSQPPAQPDGLRQPELVNLKPLAPDAKTGIRLDIRYATANNFMGAPLYSRAEAYLQKPAAEAVLRAHQWLAQFGYGLLIHDAYRPWRVTKMFWEATPAAQRNFVANPATGSRHNRGCAVDLSMYSLADGKAVEMPSGFDEFSDRAYANYPGGTQQQRWLRALLRQAMEDQGFRVNSDEWWHFDYKDWKSYPVLNTSFEDLLAR
jgi:CubicO group peptidase (beta-lactamase class C family)/D-alanyl-D-alanine dipeptidase